MIRERCKRKMYYTAVHKVDEKEAERAKLGSRGTRREGWGERRMDKWREWCLDRDQRGRRRPRQTKSAKQETNEEM